MNIEYKKVTLTLVLSFISFVSAAQNWVVDMEEAKQIATESDRKILLVFQGSDWCAPCIKLDKEVWSTEIFQNYAEEHFVLLQADFPRKKANKLPKAQQEKNNALAEKYNSQGFFPLVVVMDNSGKVLGEMGYKKMLVEDYIKLLSWF